MNIKWGGAVLGRTTQEKDLGVTISAEMKVSEQCRFDASKGNQMIGLIRRTIPCPLAIWILLFWDGNLVKY